MFRGTFDQKIDEKGRVNVPAKFRDVLRTSDDERLFITNFAVQSVRCLDAYPYSAWLRLEARLRERGDRSPEIIQFFQNFAVWPKCESFFTAPTGQQPFQIRSCNLTYL